jgi:TatD DNase family protein
MLIDTHCHINIMLKKAFDVALSTQELADAKKIVELAQTNNINKIINVGTSVIESQNCLALAKEYEACTATVGIHPNDCTTDWQDDFKQIIAMLNADQDNNIVGIGECGIDLHYKGYNLERQQAAFRAHIELAIERKLPLVVHSRDAQKETMEILKEYKDTALFGVIHCFSGDLTFAQQAVAWGFVIGIDGPITYPNNHQLREVVQTIGLGNIILETDAPFLPPQIIRGKKNHPLHIRTIAAYIATMLSTTEDVVANITTDNAQRIFRL